MPYRDRGKWRGVVTVKGKRFSASFGTKREASVWENVSREKLSSSQKSMDFISFSTKYLELAASRFVNNTYREKATLNRDFLQFIGSNLQVEKITARHIQDYLLEQAQKRGNNSANKDRKNLLAMWNWGQKILDLPVNPVTKTYKLPHDKKPTRHLRKMFCAFWRLQIVKNVLSWIAIFVLEPGGLKFCV